MSLVDHSMRPSVADRIHDSLENKFALIKPLGSGAFGRIHLAVNLLSNQQVALKIIRKVSDSQYMNHVVREVCIQRVLQHPNIVKIYDVFETPSYVIAEMEYADGGNLFSLIRRKGRLDEEEARRLFREILSALEYCHGNYIIHRDLKGENILLNSRNQVKLADFGFVKVYEDSKRNTICGTFDYLAPEIIQNKNYRGPEVDVWSLGILLYEMLSGHPPFKDLTAMTIGDLSFPEYFSEDSKNIIQKMLTVDTNLRVSISDLRTHNWTNHGYTTPPTSFLSSNNDKIQEFDYNVYLTMEKLGFSANDIRTRKPSAVSLYNLVSEHSKSRRGSLNKPGDIEQISSRNEVHGFHRSHSLDQRTVRTRKPAVESGTRPLKDIQEISTQIRLEKKSVPNSNVSSVRSSANTLAQTPTNTSEIHLVEKSFLKRIWIRLKMIFSGRRIHPINQPRISRKQYHENFSRVYELPLTQVLDLFKMVIDESVQQHLLQKVKYVGKYEAHCLAAYNVQICVEICQIEDNQNIYRIEIQKESGDWRDYQKISSTIAKLLDSFSE